MLVFEEVGKTGGPRGKNLPSKVENVQQQAQPTHDARHSNQTQATLVGGECSHHHAFPTPPKTEII